ncbi:MAG: bifunctional oligoribonuclease/PAP phosphatase NrnA [Lachnospiraceae bacterium]|nr:bifunctional oligoribonuclease/PAP phosphatase NrnA [Lachnospiraceae bacterium]
MKKNIDDFFTNEIRTVAIAGHVNPDGDCVGSVTALFLYIQKHFPDISVKLYLEQPKEDLMFLVKPIRAIFEKPAAQKVDLFVTCDVSSFDRIGLAGELFEEAGRTLCIDHHVSNTGFAEETVLVPDVSSCAEVLFYMMEEGKIDLGIAEALYTGMIHDSGVFQYKNTRPETLEAAAALLRKGIDFSSIIDNSFNTRTYVQNRVMGHVLEGCRMYGDGLIVAGSITYEEMDQFGATKKDLDMIVAQLRLTKGVEAAVFVYQTDENEFKVSLRSNNVLNVANVAGKFGGGGHVRAAGCTIEGDVDYAERVIVAAIMAELGVS